MVQINDDPQIRAMERTGFPTWLPVLPAHNDEDDNEIEYFEEGDFSDVFYGNEGENF